MDANVQSVERPVMKNMIGIYAYQYAQERGKSMNSNLYIFIRYCNSAILRKNDTRTAYSMKKGYRKRGIGYTVNQISPVDMENDTWDRAKYNWKLISQVNKENSFIDIKELNFDYLAKGIGSGNDWQGENHYSEKEFIINFKNWLSELGIETPDKIPNENWFIADWSPFENQPAKTRFIYARIGFCIV